MKIVVDKDIPFVKGCFEKYGEVQYLAAGEIVRESLMDADALIVRSRTLCNRELLEGTPVKLIATTATLTGHIDKAWCSENGIFVQSSAGSDDGAIMNYVMSAVYATAARKGMELKGKTVGVVGVGSAGQAVEDAFRYLGYTVLLYDPERAAAEGPGRFSSLEDLLASSDIVSLHRPYVPGTPEIADADFFSHMKSGATFINCSHGKLVNEADLMEAIPKLGSVIIDCWQKEPDVNIKLVNMVDIATPHIAGFSYQSMLNAASMVVRTVARFFHLDDLYDYYPEPEVDLLAAVHLDLNGKSQGEVTAAMQYNYPIFTDDFMFRTNPGAFTAIRAAYRYRREFMLR